MNAEISSETSGDSGASASGFSFLSGAAESTSEGVNRGSESTLSGFSFLSGAAESTSKTVTDESESTSLGFSFLSTTAESTNEGVSGRSETSLSGFSFLSNPVESNGETTLTGTSAASAFSFMTASSTSSTNVAGNDNSMLGPAVVTNEEIKLGKVASNKVVKKKKRTGKVVGFARDEDDEVEEKVETYPQETSASTNSYAANQHYSSSPVVTTIERKVETIPPISVANAYTTSVNAPPPPLNPPPPIPVVYNTPVEIAEVPVVYNQSNDAHTEPSAHNTSVISPSVKNNGTSTPAPTSATTIIDNPDMLNTNTIQSLETKLQTEIEKIISSFISKTESLCSAYKGIKSSLLHTKKSMSDEESHIKAILQELSELEIEQQKLAEAEEFDKADSLTTKVDASRVKMQNQMNNLNDLKSTYSRLEDQLTQNKADQCNSVNELRGSLLLGSKREDDDVQKLIHENSVKCKKEKSRLQIEEDRINLELRLVEREEETLTEESKTTNDAIQAQSGDAQSLKVEIDDKLKILAVEIEDLEARLLTKRAEERKCRLELGSVEAKIGDVNRKYERQLQRISDRRTDIIKNKAECMKEAEALLIEKRNYQKDAEVVDNLSELIKDWRDSISNTVEVTNILDKIMHHNAAPDCSPRNDPGGSKDDFQRLYQSFRAADDHFTKCVSEQRNLVNKLTEFTDEINDIDDKLPKFENEKKAHAAAKRFKEAAKTASDIKEITSRREVISNEMNEISEKLPVVEESVSVALTQKETAQLLLKEAQKLEDIRKFNGMLQRMKVLRSTKNKMGTLNESNDTAIDRVVQACCVMIDTELDDVFLEAQEIKREYSLEQSIECNEEVNEDVTVSTSTTTPIDTKEEATDLPISLSNENLEDAINEIASNNLTRTISEEESGATLLKAGMLMIEYEELTAALQTASDNEDYELAAEIDERIRNDIKVNLSTCMILLGVQSEDELKQLIEQRK